MLRSAYRFSIIRFSKPFRRPRIQAARNRLLAAAALGRDVQADDVRVGDEAEIARGIEEQFWLGMHGVERLLRQCILQLAGAAGERGQCRRPEDRDADVGEAVRAAAQAAHHEGNAVAQRQPVRRQLLLLHQLFECGDDAVLGRQIDHGIAELTRPLPGEVGLCRIDLDGV